MLAKLLAVSCVGAPFPLWLYTHLDPATPGFSGVFLS